MNYRISKDKITVTYIQLENLQKMPVKIIEIDKNDFEDFIIEKGYLECCEDCFNPSSLYGHYQKESTMSIDELYETNISNVIEDYLECIEDNKQ